jgi:hypothetical protein
MKTSKTRLIAIAALATSMLLAPLAGHAQYRHGPNASEASAAASVLPMALSVAAPVVMLSAGAVLTVVAVDASARGAVWVLERASDGARMSVEVAGTASMVVGGAVIVTALSTGWVLHQASRAVLFIPNEIGGSLLYNQRLSY